MDPSGSIATAIAVRGDRILALGDDACVQAYASQTTRIINAGGRTMLPGFIDAHTHFQKAALSRLFAIDYLETAPATLDDVLAAVRQKTISTPAARWIRGDALDAHALAENRFPTRWELDSVAPDHPIVILSVGNHNIAANSLALRLAGITSTTPDPPGGRIERGIDGQPTGVLRELGKLRLDPNRPGSLLPAFTPAERLGAIQAGIDHLHANGITGIHDVVMDPDEVNAYMQLRSHDALHLRVQMLVRGVESKIPLDCLTGLGITHGFGDEYLRLGGVKMSVDGTCEERNAAVADAYPGEPDNFGLVRIPQSELEDAVQRCQERGMRVAIHAIGQRAVDMALDAIAKAQSAAPHKGLHHRIEHAYLPPRPGQLARMHDLGVIVSTQPATLWHNGDRWCDIWPETALSDVMPIRAILDAHIPVILGTDYPCVPIDPLANTQAAVAHTTRSGRRLAPGQAITVDEALRLQTVAVADCGGEGHLKGSLEPGKLADLIMLSADPYRLALDEIASAEVEFTMVGGIVTFSKMP